MATAGTLIYSTKLDTSGMDKGLKGMTSKVSNTGSTIKSILGGLGIAALVSKGINMISSSMDGAIKRLDTMNNFPKVMSNLGIDAEQSSKAIDKLSKGLENVPTTLDEAALAVQRFASVNSDVGKSADMFLAVNDAILAGGASAQVQSSALEQLSQAYSKGKPDMMEWRTIQMAMPAQLKQVALAMGYAGGNTAQLGEDLRSGKVTMDQFVQTIMKLDKEGTNGFQSFADQAKNSVGGVQTSITNMKTAITRGVAGAIGQLDQSLKDSGLGGLSGVITKIGKAAEEMIKKVTPLIPPVINALVDLYHWMKEHETLVKILAGAVLTLVTAFKAIAIIKSLAGPFATLVKAIKTGVTIFKTLVTILKVVGTAFKALGVIMMANPISIVIAIIVALVAAFVLLWNKSEAFRNFWIGIWEAIKSAVLAAWDFIKEAVSSIVEFFKSVPEKIAAIPEKVISFLEKIPYYIGYAIGWIIGKYVEFYTKIWNFITKDIPNIVKSVVDWLKELPGKIWDILVTAVVKVSEWIVNMKNKAIEAGKNFVNNAINFIKELPGKIWTWLVNTINKIVTWISNLKAKATQAASTLVNTIVNGVKSLPSKMANIGKNIVTGIWNGIKNAKDWLLGKVKDFASGIVSGIKKSLKIGSPSKVFADEVGRWIPEGVAVGIDANTDSALQSINDMSDEIVQKMQSAINLETGRLSANASVKGNSNNVLVVNNNNKLFLDGDEIYHNQQKVTSRHELQTQFGGGYSVSS